MKSLHAAAGTGDAELDIQMVVAHLVSLKDVIAAGFRSPSVLRATIERAPREQRQSVLSMDSELRGILAKAALGCSAVEFGSPYQGGSPTPSRLTSSYINISPSQNGSSSPVSPTGRVSSMSPDRTADANGDAVAPEDALLLRFRDAFLGVPDAPRPIGLERIPRPPTLGLIHGNERPIKAFLHQHRTVLNGLVGLLGAEESSGGGGLLDALSFLNMAWLQQHPLDFEAAAIESSRFKNASQPKKFSSGSQTAAPSLLSSSSMQQGANCGNVGGVSSRGAVDELSPLENSMRYLLFLNLNLKYPANQWVPLLQVRDDVMNSARSFRKAFDGVIASANISVSCFPSVLKIYNALDMIVSCATLLNYLSAPAEIQGTMFDKFSNALMELQVVMHEHSDVSRNKKVCKAVEDVCQDVVALLKENLGVLGAHRTAEDEGNNDR